jgi:hypothetical protein
VDGPTVDMVDAILERMTFSDFGWIIRSEYRKTLWLAPNGDFYNAYGLGTIGVGRTHATEIIASPLADAQLVLVGEFIVFFNRLYSGEFLTQAINQAIQGQESTEPPKVRIKDGHATLIDDGRPELRHKILDALGQTVG